MHVKFLESGFIYKPTEIKTVLHNALNETMLVYDSKHKMYYYNVPCAFDIETTSFWDCNGKSINYKQYCKLTGENKAYFEMTDTEKANKKLLDANKRAIMYHWQFGINGRVIMGRTWDEFVLMCDTISDYLKLQTDKCLIVYVHNLSFEFQFLMKRFKWDTVFSLDSRKPVYARTMTGIEFRCSYKLSNFSLAKLGDQLTKYKVQKMTGDLDYSLLRSYLTPLSDKEQKYCENDVRVVMAYIQEQIEQNNGIQNIPLTSTGFVRREMRNNCFAVRGYKTMIHKLVATPAEFNLWRRSFAGGFTHANALYVRQEMTDVDSFDFTSSYPYIMCSFDGFPISSGIRIKINNSEQFYSLINNYACMFDIKLYDIVPKLRQDNPISISKCWDKGRDVKVNNGRVVSADYIGTTLTDIDFKVIQQFYDIRGGFEIGMFYRYKRGYLPRPIIETVLDLYRIKTTLKGVSGKEVEYLAGKAKINACYGMMVTNPIRDEIIFNGTWQPPEPQELLTGVYKYNVSKSRFSSYNWGCYITSVARANLFSGIAAFGNDYIYSDTDSIKVINSARHMDYINAYNKGCDDKLLKMCNHYNFDYSLTRPLTIKGVSKPLGVWDKETAKPWKRFKTLGAKRYLIEDSDGNLEMTVAGLGKKAGLNYLIKEYQTADNVFIHFNDGLQVPASDTGKNLHTYIDDEETGVIVDYNGTPAEYDELTAVHLQPNEYNLSMAQAFIDYLAGYKNE